MKNWGLNSIKILIGHTLLHCTSSLIEEQQVSSSYNFYIKSAFNTEIGLKFHVRIILYYIIL